MDLIEIVLGISIVAVVIATVFLIYRRSRPTTEVLLCRARNRTGERVVIKNDFAETMETEIDRKPCPLFFWKYHGGYAFNEGGRIIRRSFAREGTAYTKDLEGSKNIEVPLSTALKAKIGEEFYKTIPAEYRNKIENSKILLTVDIEEGITPEGYSPMSSEDIYAEGDRKAARIYNKEMTAEEKSAKSRLFDILLGAMLASTIVLLMVLMGWIGVPHEIIITKVVS